ncbi:hypothetical protein BDQ12DRAFT_698864 [Crucibulum laeve]|uniref:Protein-S-isoprenylcysteine O-methyltransferase n=1 Tax=Crucibulum laeve TaxID=68775 RepID=A0A5C3LZR9_9AGAR|nr:hypothetical protein BDQ12DRAFT_698864 [Crucibulum laeve]
MSALRVPLLVLQAVCIQLACSPPRPSPSKGRYHVEEMFLLRIAPAIFRIQQIFTWMCTAFELLCYIETIRPLPAVLSNICPSTSTSIRLTTPFVVGVLAVILATVIRRDCYNALGPLFTFDLTIHPQHRLVTERCYSYVRHPAYAGSLLLIWGLSLSHLTKGSWITECGPLHTGLSRYSCAIIWSTWALSVCVSRAKAEDQKMKEMFRDEWEAYTVAVPYWFFPCLL